MNLMTTRTSPRTLRSPVTLIMALIAALALALMPALSASAETYDYINGSIDSRPSGARATNSPYSSEHAVTWSSKTKARVIAKLYDNAANGRGATLVASANYYNSANNFVGQRVGEDRNTNGADTSTYALITLDKPPVGAVRAQIYLFVCDGKDADGRNEHCGDGQTFNP